MACTRVLNKLSLMLWEYIPSERPQLTQILWLQGLHKRKGSRKVGEDSERSRGEGCLEEEQCTVSQPFCITACGGQWQSCLEQWSQGTGSVCTPSCMDGPRAERINILLCYRSLVSTLGWIMWPLEEGGRGPLSCPSLPASNTQMASCLGPGVAGLLVPSKALPLGAYAWSAGLVSVHARSGGQWELQRWRRVQTAEDGHFFPLSYHL